jgi:HD domain-containing protein
MSLTASQTSNLAPDKGKNSKPKQISRFIASAIRERAFRTSLAVGLKRLHAVVPADWAAPDSRLADEARTLATELCSPVLVAHSERTYCFGAILAARDGLKMDRELFYIACLLHDLGLSELHRDKPGSFEWVGAREAHRFCLDRDLPEAKADLVHDAVALHSSVGLANKREPEVAFVHYGAGLDLLGKRVDHIPKPDLTAVLDRYTRDGFKQEFTCCLVHQHEAKPTSHIAGHVALGLADLIPEELT